jgi:RNA polymerase sigma-54 factor
MVLELRQQLKMTQQLVMTPQLQQAIKLLQLNHLELAELVGNEMVENPVLEELHEEREDPIAQAQAEQAEVKKEDPNAEGSKEQTDIDWERYLDSYQGGQAPGSGIRRDFEDLPGYDQTLQSKTTLSEHLMWQLQMTPTSYDLRAAAAAIIGNLDADGYLQTPLDGIGERNDFDAILLAEALEVVQSFDPMGVGARDLRECLIIQARLVCPEDRVVAGILEDHVDRLENRDYKRIARSLGVSFQRVLDAVRTISSMEPKPGRPFTSEEPRYITPDIYVIKSGDEYIIQLNEEGVPRLRVSRYYRGVLASAKKEEKEYIQDKLRSAQWLIRSIYQRQRTIYKVTESIVKQQRQFFDEGIGQLKPMILRDVADDIEMHESTVSRVTSNKYVHTHHGIFPLKFFFNSSIQKGDGDSVASEMVKQRIQAMVGDENPQKPYSDQKIVEMLKAEDITIARRTVAKYRDMLQIPSSSQRKRLF